MNDPVNHPSHYTAGAVECIDAIEAAMTFEEFVGFLRGQMIKYVWRAGKKDDAREDIEKALWYGNRLADRLLDKEQVEDDNAFMASLSSAKPATRWLDLSDMAEAAFRTEMAGAPLSIAELRAARELRAAEADLGAIAAKEAELRKLSHLEDTDGNVVLMYSDYVNWDEAPEWANFLAYDERLPGGVADNYRAYWLEHRPEWRAGLRYWASGGQGGRIQYAEPYSGQGGDPRLFVRADTARNSPLGERAAW